MGCCTYTTKYHLPNTTYFYLIQTFKFDMYVFDKLPLLDLLNLEFSFCHKFKRWKDFMDKHQGRTLQQGIKKALLGQK